jgi:hypothetical protein
MRNPMLPDQTPIAITITILFLFQIAILAVPMSASFQEDDHSTWNTYVRSIINSVAPATAR